MTEMMREREIDDLKEVKMKETGRDNEKAKNFFQFMNKFKVFFLLKPCL